MSGGTRSAGLFVMLLAGCGDRYPRNNPVDPGWEPTAPVAASCTLASTPIALGVTDPALGFYADAAALGDRALVVWRGSSGDVSAQVLDASGARVGGGVLAMASGQLGVSVAPISSGWVVCWNGGVVQCQLVDVSGVPSGSVVTVSEPDGVGGWPGVSVIDAAGSVWVAWRGLHSLFAVRRLNEQLLPTAAQANLRGAEAVDVRPSLVAVGGGVTLVASAFGSASPEHQSLGPDGAPIGTRTEFETIAQTGATDLVDPIVVGFDDRYFVAWLRPNGSVRGCFVLDNGNQPRCVDLPGQLSAPWDNNLGARYMRGGRIGSSAWLVNQNGDVAIVAVDGHVSAFASAPVGVEPGSMVGRPVALAERVGLVLRGTHASSSMLSFGIVGCTM